MSIRIDTYFSGFFHRSFCGSGIVVTYHAAVSYGVTVVALRAIYAIRRVEEFLRRGSRRANGETGDAPHLLMAPSILSERSDYVASQIRESPRWYP